MMNGKVRYLVGVGTATTLIAIVALLNWGTSRASDDDVETNSARIEQHEREANEKFTMILINQSSIATSIDFLVAAQDPHRKPIAPTIEATTVISP